ncbi:MAG TPA: hypothetical protein PKE29_05860 [Phycisphaerales bacterium]|nr:hypothetical protein [Phycisphaerales bacterium]
MPQVRFSVVCVNEDGSFFRVNLIAPSAEAAAAEARKQGYVVAITYLEGLARADQNRILRGLRRDGSNCPVCGYSLAGLPRKDGVVTCPECGFGDPVEDARKHNEREASPGKMFAAGGMFFAFVEAVSLARSPGFPFTGCVGVVLAIVGYERSRGRHGRIAVAVAGAVVVAGVIRMFWGGV